MTRTGRRVLPATVGMTVVALTILMFRPMGPEHVPGRQSIPEWPASAASTADSGTSGTRTAQVPSHHAEIGQSTPSATRIAVLRERLARSGLRDADPDGAITFAPGGQVQADRAMRRLFDWYLALSGEVAPFDIRTLLAADLTERHGDTIAAEVLGLFDRYLDLQRAAAALDSHLDDHARLIELRALRRQWFGDAADTMFGEEETDLARTLDRMALLSDPSLSSDERAALAAELDTAQPAAEREIREETAIAALADEQSLQFDALRTDIATRHQERADLFGDAAADRLAALDAERTSWESRVSDYLRERDALRNGNFDAPTRDAQIEQLRERSFAEHELRRVDALDAIGALPPGG